MEEVEQYEDIAYRRLLVKPGITGLGRCRVVATSLWEESVRLDLYYVENWSLTGDFIILLRTVRAVFAKEARTKIRRGFPTGVYAVLERLSRHRHLEHRTPIRKCVEGA